MRRLCRTNLTTIAAATLIVFLGGCTSVQEYIGNGFKVGPNYCPPKAPVAKHWIDESDLRVDPDPTRLCRWWTVFNDPKLDYLINCAYRQNLTLKEAGFRVLQARAERAIAAGNLFPQQQGASGSYNRIAAAIDPGGAAIGRYSDRWRADFNLSWELDFWGRFRRAVAAADDRLDASVEGYDAVLVTLLGDVAQSYVQIRTDQERIRLLQYNLDNVQTEVWRRSKERSGVDVETGKRRPVGGVVLESDYHVAESTLKQTTAAIAQLKIDQRQAENLLCILLGMPPVDMANLLGTGPIPNSPPEVAIGIPADLLRRRPDVRQAERLAAAQAEEIGIAQADLYPAFSINGTLGYSARNFPDLFKQTAFNGNVGPSFQWALLNYGRIINNVRLQDARFQELAVFYQDTVLQANREVEDGLVAFLQAQRRAKLLNEAVTSQAKAVDIAKERYMRGAGGESGFTTYTVYEQSLLQEQDASAQAVGQIAQGLIAVYRALGGGWEIRLGSDGAEAPRSPEELDVAKPSEEVPMPRPNTSNLPVAPSPPDAPAAP